MSEKDGQWMRYRQTINRKKWKQNKQSKKTDDRIEKDVSQYKARRREEISKKTKSQIKHNLRLKEK